MFITKKHIPRRKFLRGVGTAMALPLLDAMIPALPEIRAKAGDCVPACAVALLAAIQS